ncbi:MAG: oxidoreductase [Vicinamibacterales bacterium]
MNGPVLITGCSSGIGRATALHLQQSGWQVYATARDVASLAPLAAAGCRTLPLDVTREETMVSAVRRIEEAHGAIGALVNNAGYSQSGAIETVPLERVRAQFETNVFGPSRLTQLVLPGMRRARAGRIVNLSSMGGCFVLPGGGYYHATKYAIEAISDALRFEVARFGIEVVVIQPGLIRTSFSDTVVAEMRRGGAPEPYAHFEAEVARITRESYVKGALARFASEPEDVARTIATALTAPRPKTRYVVSPSAHLLLALRKLLPDRLWDRFLARTYQQSGS